MPVLVVADPDDPRLDDYRNVPDAALLEQRGIFIAEGRLVVRRLLTASRFRPRSVMATVTARLALLDVLDDDTPLPIYVVPQALMDGVAGFNIHRGCLAVGERRPDSAGAEAAALRDGYATELAAGASRLLMLERVANPDNVGALFRNAAALGVDAVILDAASSDPLYRKAIRTSMGAALQLPFARADDWPGTLASIRRCGLTRVALTPEAGAAPFEDVAVTLRAGRVALVLGHEGEGLTPATLAACDIRARIAMTPGMDSLNVATTAALALYELARR